MKTLQIAGQILLFVVVLLGIGLFAAGGHSGHVEDTSPLAIKRSADIVEPWLGMPELRVKWRSDMTSSRLTAGAGLQKGVKSNDELVVSGMDLRGTSEVIEYEPGVKIVVREDTDSYEATWTYTLQDSGRRTRIDAAVDLQYKGFFGKLFSPITRLSMAERTREDLDELARIVERDY